MSKITFRADDELVQRLEEFDASKSEVMREALREYLDGAERASDDPSGQDGTVDDALSARIDELMADRLDEFVTERLDELVTERLDERLSKRANDRDINVNVNIEGNSDTTASLGAESARPAASADGRKTRAGDSVGDTPDQSVRTCDQCGESVSDEHVYCPNCGEKSTHRVFCECGDEVRSDWVFCPGCGRRTPAADVLDRT